MEENSKSGMDILDEILEKLDLLEKKIDLIDANIKNLINGAKAASPEPSRSKISAAPPPKQAQIQAIDKPDADENGFHNFKFQPTDAAKIKQDSPLAAKNRAPTNNLGYIVVTGKMISNINGKITPLSGVKVRIFNDSDVLVKETFTNRSGHWTSHLIPGKYVANFSGEINGKKLIEQNRNFVAPEKLPEGQTELVVN